MLREAVSDDGLLNVEFITKQQHTQQLSTCTSSGNTGENNDTTKAFASDINYCSVNNINGMYNTNVKDDAYAVKHIINDTNNDNINNGIYDTNHHDIYNNNTNYNDKSIKNADCVHYAGSLSLIAKENVTDSADVEQKENVTKCPLGKSTSVPIPNKEGALSGRDIRCVGLKRKSFHRRTISFDSTNAKMSVTNVTNVGIQGAIKESVRQSDSFNEFANLNEHRLVQRNTSLPTSHLETFLDLGSDLAAHPSSPSSTRTPSISMPRCKSLNPTPLILMGRAVVSTRQRLLSVFSIIVALIINAAPLAIIVTISPYLMLSLLGELEINAKNYLKNNISTMTSEDFSKFWVHVETEGKKILSDSDTIFNVSLACGLLHIIILLIVGGLTVYFRHSEEFRSRGRIFVWHYYFSAVGMLALAIVFVAYSTLSFPGQDVRKMSRAEYITTYYVLIAVW
eukprot:Awhi_evm1s7136